MLRLHQNHEHCWELIPWTVNGRASEVQQQAVLAHAEDCLECRQELQRHRELQRHMRGTDEVIAAPSASWQKLLAEIDGQPAAPVNATPGVRRPWLIAALWLQLVAIAVLAGALFRSTSDPAPLYSTLSAPSISPGDLRVVFSPAASLSEVNGLLRQLQCNVVAGPSEAGVYTLAAAEGVNPEQLIQALRQHDDVLFAERNPTVAGPGR